MHVAKHIFKQFLFGEIGLQLINKFVSNYICFGLCCFHIHNAALLFDPLRLVGDHHGDEKLCKQNKMLKDQHNVDKVGVRFVISRYLLQLLACEKDYADSNDNSSHRPGK